MPLLQSTSLSNQDITSALLVATYTATREVSDLSIQVAIDQVSGNGSYSIYATRQLAGAGSAYTYPTITETLASGETSHLFSPIELAINDTDVVKVYVTGLVTDDTTPDITTEFWGFAATASAGGSSSSIYASLAEYKTWIAARGLSGSVGSDSSDDSVIQILLEAASRYIDRQSGKRFYLPVSDETRYYTPEEDNLYEVKIEPFGSVTSVSVDYEGLRSYTLLSATDYDLLPVNADLDGFPYTCIEINTMLSSAYFPYFRNAVKVIGKSGWPSCPKDIQEACLSIAQNLNGARSGQTSGGKVTLTAAGVVIRPEDVPPFAQKIIESYRSMT